MTRAIKLWTIAYKVTGIMVALLVVAAIVLVSINNAQLRAENQAMYADLQASQDNAQRLYEQLLDLPGVEPDGEDPSDVTTTPAVPGATGPVGPRGDEGRPPTANEILGAVGEYCASSGQCQGVPGAAGPAGQPGAAGATGETVVGPAGPQGVQGDPGAQGPEGPAGATGPAGPTCPEGFTLQSVYVSTDPLLFTGTLALACVPSPIPEGEAP